MTAVKYPGPIRALAAVAALSFTSGGLLCLCPPENHQYAHHHDDSTDDGSEDPSEPGHHHGSDHPCRCPGMLAAPAERAAPVQTVHVSVDACRRPCESVVLRNLRTTANESPPGRFGTGTSYLDHAVLLL